MKEGLYMRHCARTDAILVVTPPGVMRWSMGKWEDLKKYPWDVMHKGERGREEVNNAMVSGGYAERIQ